ncbi:hypothetical protein BHM03_00022655 [Ensete ventricosum]|nr:hypothetical protein BHM03_00022655 [Ensete ventricosum]
MRPYLASPSTSPPTPPSPLPISVGPGNRKYPFTPSPSPSPPFTTPNHSSPETSPLLHRRSAQLFQEPSVFSLDGFAEKACTRRKWWHHRSL